MSTAFRYRHMDIVLGKVVGSSLDESFNYAQIYLTVSGESHPTPLYVRCIGRVIESKLYPGFVLLVYDRSESIYLRQYYIVDDSFYRVVFLSDNIILL